jgi:hypothetical protein
MNIHPDPAVIIAIDKTAKLFTKERTNITTASKIIENVTICSKCFSLLSIGYNVIPPIIEPAPKEDSSSPYPNTPRVIVCWLANTGRRAGIMLPKNANAITRTNID